MSARETKQHTEEKAVHKMTAAERTAMDKYLARCEATPSIRCKVSRNGSDLQIELDHPDEQTGHALMMDALASADGCFVSSRGRARTGATLGSINARKSFERTVFADPSSPAMARTG